MSTVMHAESRSLYSWWWDSHISPKNSKWLQENLADMDLKVKAMIKLIEEDADSFARRAEMYYKKRPELMKFVEDFYRAYRSLAERYDHATGALRHAHQTIAEAFPNHIPLALPDESPSISPGTDLGPCTPENSSHLLSPFDPNDLQKDALGGACYFHTVNRNVAYAEENESIATRKGLKQLNDLFCPREATFRMKLQEVKVRKGLNFYEDERSVSLSQIQESKLLLEQEVREKEDAINEIKRLQDDISQLSIENKKLKTQIESDSMRFDSSRGEVQNLSDVITKLQSEKDAASLLDPLSYERMSSTEIEIFEVKTELGKLHEEIMMGIVKFCNAEEQCFHLEKANQSLILELEQCKKVLEEIRAVSVENQDLVEQAVEEKDNAKNEIKCIHEQLLMLSNENQCLKIQALSEAKHLQLFIAELQSMRVVMTKLESEKEAAILMNQLFQKSISSFEAENFQAKDEIGQLHAEILMGVVKLCTAEEQYLALEKADQMLKLELEDRKKVLDEIQMLSVESQNLLEQEVREKENIKNEIECLQGEVSQLSIENKNIKNQFASKTKHLDAYRTEVQNLRNTVSILECVKEDAVFKNQLSLESITSLKNEIFRAKKEIGKLHEEVLMGIVKLYSADEQHILLESANQNLKLEIEEKKTLYKDLRISLQLSDEKWVEAEISLQSLKGLYNLSQEKVEHMTQEIQYHSERLKDIELSKMGLEEEVSRLKDLNYNFNEHILSFDPKLKLLQDEIVSLKEINSELKNEISIHLEDNKLRQQEIDSVKDDRDKLELKYKGLIEQMEVASLNMDSLEILIKELQFGCVELKDGCKKLEDEKLLLFNKLQDMETISERSTALEGTLSDAMKKIRILEDSCKSLTSKDSTHVVEKAALFSQIQIFAENMEELSEKNSITEDSLAHANTELEVLRLKLRDFKESCQFLSDQNSNLLLQKEALISQVESFHCSLTNLEFKYSTLEIDHINLLEEKEVSVAKVIELKNAMTIKQKEYESLIQSKSTCMVALEGKIHLLQEDSKFNEKELEVVHKEYMSYLIEILVLQRCFYDMKDYSRTEKQKHESLILSSEIQLADLESQINHMLEKSKVTDEEFEEQQQKYMNSMLDVFILQRCLSEMNEKNFILLQECQKHTEASRCSGELVSQLEGSKLLLKEENMLLVDRNARLINGIDLLLESLDVNKKLLNTDGSEDYCLQTVLGEVNNLLAYISDSNDKNQLLHLGLSVYHTFLKQNTLEKFLLGQELESIGGQLLVFQREQDQLLEKCKKLGQHVNEKKQINELLKAELESSCKLLSDLAKDFSNLREEKSALEEENSILLEEAVALEYLYLFFSSSNAENLHSLKMVDDTIRSLVADKNDREWEIRESEERFKVVYSENKQLKEDSLILMEELSRRTTMLDFDMFTIRNFCEELILQVETGDHLLKKKSMELLEAYHKLRCAQVEVTELRTKLNIANNKVDEAKIIKVQYEENFACLLEGTSCKDVEINTTREENRILNEQLNRLTGKFKVLRKREQYLSSELQMKICEIDRCEGEITNLLIDIQVSAVNRAVFEDKMLEWTVEYQGVEICALVQREMLIEGITLRNAHALKLQKKLDDLEAENRGFKAFWDSCLPLYISLESGILAVENQAQQISSICEGQDISLTDPQEKKNNDARKGDFDTITGALKLQNLVSRLEELEKLMLLTTSQLKQERLLYASNLESARREIEELKLETSGKQVLLVKETSGGKDGQMIKDIELDRVSNSLLPSRIQSAESEDQMLKLWETADGDYSNSVSNDHGADGVQEFKSEPHSSEIVAEKEVGVDKLEISAEMKESQEEWNMSAIKRFTASTEKLSILKTTAQKLRTKLERSGNSEHKKCSEHNALQTKLKQAEEGILLLVDTDGKLRKKLEESSKLPDGEKMGWLDRRQVSEQVLIVSDQIEKLEQELQEIHYFLVKFDEEAESKRTQEGDRRPQQLLRDYINGWRVGQSRKRGRICGCIRPKTYE